MKRHFRTSLFLCAGNIATAISSPVLAQDPGAPATDLEAIVVTARRVEERLQDVPISISVYNQEQLSNRNIFNAADLGTFTPSLSTNARYGPEKASFSIRGFVQDLATAPSVGVYFADVVAPRGAGATTSGNGVGVGNMFDLQSVQVLKGPQGTLFGRNTTGGAVLLVPQRPTDELEGYVEGSVGNYDMRRVQAVVNLPLADRFRARFGVDRMTRDGYLINHSGIGPDRLANVDYVAARVSLVGDLADNLENYTIGTYSFSDSHGVVPRVVACHPTSTTGRLLACPMVARQNARGDGWWDVENSLPDPKVEMRTWQIINTTTWHASDTLTIKNIASYGEFREIARMNLDGENFAPPGQTTGVLVVGLRNTPGYFNSNQSTFTEELQFQGSAIDGRLKWQAGGYMETSNPIGYSSQSTQFLIACEDPDNLRCAPTTTGNIARPYQKVWFRSRGLYSQATYDLTDTLSVTGGLRYTWDKMRHLYAGQAIRFPAANTPVYTCGNVVRIQNPDGSIPVVTTAEDFLRCAVDFTTRSDKPTWMVDVDYRPSSDLLLYAKWSRGYRAGGAAAANVHFETWRPEKVDSYEIGAKAAFRGALRGYFNVAGFYNDFRSQQIQATLVRAPTSPLLGGSAIVNAGKSRIWGIEVDSSIRPFSGLSVDVGYTYLNTKLLALTPVEISPEVSGVYQAVVPTATVGGSLSLSPKNRVSVTGTYTLPLDQAVGAISFGATYVHTDSQIASQATLPQFGVLPATDLLNLNVTWKEMFGRPFDLSLFATNVTNEAFPLHVTNAYNSFGFESQITNEPRMYGARLRVRFGG